jgi:hypothetical protein
VKLAMSDCIVLFGRMEQEIVEVIWLLKSADVAARVKIARELEHWRSTLRKQAVT